MYKKRSSFPGKVCHRNKSSRANLIVALLLFLLPHQVHLNHRSYFSVAISLGPTDNTQLQQTEAASSPESIMTRFELLVHAPDSGIRPGI